MKKVRKKGSGGKRQGAGAKLKFGEPSDNLTIRVPVSKKQRLKVKWQGEADGFRI
tara:strand:+ start:860 stop:1024 length:165 start_codon:yes stop_codon:yes gene_type:complete